MKEPVHILVTCYKPDLLPAATLVFKTLRVGFPEADVYVWESINNHSQREKTRAAVADTGAHWVGRGDYRNHDDWIGTLISHYRNPFWICDTDIVFWRRFEHKPDGRSALAGVR